jgi:hypothetical protein
MMLKYIKDATKANTTKNHRFILRLGFEVSVIIFYMSRFWENFQSGYLQYISGRVRREEEISIKKYLRLNPSLLGNFY